jgi:hypothetical protein
LDILAARTRFDPAQPNHKRRRAVITILTMSRGEDFRAEVQRRHRHSSKARNTH